MAEPNSISDFDRLKAETERARVDLDRERVELDRRRVELEHYKAVNDAGKPAVEALFRFADLTVRSLLVMNGGAALGLLTFAANTGKIGGVDAQVMANGVWWFAIGAALSVATAASSYLAQVAYLELMRSDGKASRIGEALRVCAILLAVASWLSFAIGMWVATSQMQAQPPAVSAPTQPPKK